MCAFWIWQTGFALARDGSQVLGSHRTPDGRFVSWRSYQNGDKGVSLHGQDVRWIVELNDDARGTMNVRRVIGWSLVNILYSL